MSFRYIGSKARVADQIGALLGAPSDGVFLDAFCGTGAVAEKAAALGWAVHLNDQLVSATTMARARLISDKEGQFKKLGGYHGAIGQLNKSKPRHGFIWREYCPASKKASGIERRYFTDLNASRIDGMREQIRRWRHTKTISSCEQTLLIADLLSGINRVANIAGTFGCFLSTWSAQSQNRLELLPRPLRNRPTDVRVTNVDAKTLSTARNDLAYFDPPYTKRQYASYYHILETVTLGDEPTVEGVAGLRPWKTLASDFCYKSRALAAVEELIHNCGARRILLSYSDEGHVSMNDLIAGISGYGSVRTHTVARIGRYRPNLVASRAGSHVHEFVIEVTKASRVRLKKPALAAA